MNLMRKIWHNICYYVRFAGRIDTVSRISMNIEFRKLAILLHPGTVLDVGAGDSPYKKIIPVIRYVTMDMGYDYRPSVVSDIHHISFKDSTFDTVIATEVLEHCHDPVKAVAEIKRTLKSGGVCILSTRFIQLYHPTPKDYYRFTQDSLSDIFKEFSEVSIIHHGNLLQSIWVLITATRLKYILNIFNPIIARINSKHTNAPCGFLVYAKK